MGLVITRRVGESFEMTWPSGEKRSLRLEPGRLLIVSDDTGVQVGRVFLPDVIGVPSSPEVMLMEVDFNRSKHGQQAIRFSGPKGVDIQRDNMKQVKK